MGNMLESVLKAFVIGATATRDESHNHVHMIKVYESSIKILNRLCSDDEYLSDNRQMFEKFITAVALLHDVSDHKYDSDGSYKNSMRLVLKDFFVSDEIDLVLNIIDRISYSKENKVIQNGDKLDWDDVLGHDGCIIRNIVSDADKIEAIGLIGVERCMMYSRHNRLKTGDSFTEKDIIQDLVKHCDEKLFRLKDEFIRTSAGKKMAEPYHDEMVKKVNELIGDYAIA